MAESVESQIRRVWQSMGLDPDLGVATAVQESGLRPDAVGDGGKSHGVFQEHDAGRGHGLPVAARQNVEAAARRAGAEFRQMLAKHPGATPGQIAAYAQRPLNPGTYARNIDANLGRMKQGMSALDAAAGGVGKGGLPPPAQARGQGVVAAGVRPVGLPARASVRPKDATLVKAGRGQPVAGASERTMVRGPRAPRAMPGLVGSGQRGAPQQQGERFWPIVGVKPGGVNNPFGASQFRSSGAEGLALPSSNTGADLTAPYGATIVAETDGVVTEVYQATGDSKRGGRNPKENGGWGGSVIVNYADGTKARYSHQAAGSIQVRPGQRVVGGQMIGQVGDSGNATGPHVDAMFWDANGKLSDIVKAGKWTPGRVTVGPEGQGLPPGQAGRATNVTARAQTPPSTIPANPAQPSTRPAVQNDPEAMAAYEAWKKTARVPNVPPAPMPSPTPAGGPPPAPMPEIGGPPPAPVPGPTPGTELLSSGANVLTDGTEGLQNVAAVAPPAPRAQYNLGLDPKLVEETQARIDAAAAGTGTGSTVVPMGQGASTRPGAAATAAAGRTDVALTDEAQQGAAIGSAVRQAGRPSGPAGPSPLQGIGDFLGKAGSTIQQGIDAIRARNPGGAATPAAGGTPAQAPQPPPPVARRPDAVPDPANHSPQYRQAMEEANAANKALYDFQDLWNKSVWLLEQAGGKAPPVDPDRPDTPEVLALREAERIAQGMKTPGSDVQKQLDTLRTIQRTAAKTLSDAEGSNPEDLAKSRGQPNPTTVAGKQGRTITNPENGQVLVEQPDGSWAPVGGTKPPSVSVHSGPDGLYVTDDGGNLINQIPIPKDGNPVVLSGNDGPELLIYDPTDGSMWWQPNKGFLNTPQEVRATSKDKYIVTQDKVTGEIVATPNPGFDERLTDSVMVSSTGQAVRIDQDGKLVSMTDTLTPAERAVYDKRSEAESGQAVTKAASDKFKLEQEQKEAEEWARIEEAINAGATPAEVRGLVMQAAKNVQDFTALQNSETQRQQQLEVGRHNLAEEGFSERTRRTAEVGEARQGVGAYQLATAPFQTALLAGLSQVTDPRKAAQQMNIGADIYEPVGQNYDAQQNRQRTIDTQREGMVQKQAEPFTSPFKPKAAQPAAAPAAAPAATPGANYGTTNPATQPSTQAPAGPRTEVSTVDLEGEGKPGYARTTYSDGTSEEWQIPLPEQPAEAPPEEPAPAPAFAAAPEDEDEGGYFVGGGGNFPALYIPRRQRGGIQSTPSGPAGGGGSPQGQGQGQGRSGGRKRRRLPVPGKHIIPLDGDWYQTHYDDGAVETWHRADGSAFEGVGGGGAGFHGEDPPTMGTYGWENGTGGGGGSIWTLPPPASVNVGFGAQMALQQPDPQRDRNGSGMAGGFAGPTPAAGGGGMPQGQQGQMGQAQAPMWDSATPAPFSTSGVSGVSGGAGQSTLYQPGASAGAGLSRYGASNVPATMATVGGGAGSGSGAPTTGYYGGPAMPQAMSPLQRLLQQTGVVPTSAGRAAGAPGTV